MCIYQGYYFQIAIMEFNLEELPDLSDSQFSEDEEQAVNFVDDTSDRIAHLGVDWFGN